MTQLCWTDWINDDKAGYQRSYRGSWLRYEPQFQSKDKYWFYYLFRVSKTWQVIVSEQVRQPDHTYEHVMAIYLEDCK